MKSKNRWQDEDESSDSDSDDERVVLSKTEKIKQEVSKTVDVLIASVDSNDWIQVTKKFQHLEKLVKKHYKKEEPTMRVSLVNFEHRKVKKRSRHCPRLKPSLQRIKQTVTKISNSRRRRLRNIVRIRQN